MKFLHYFYTNNVFFSLAFCCMLWLGINGLILLFTGYNSRYDGVVFFSYLGLSAAYMISSILGDE